jgi:hypothetical protein
MASNCSAMLDVFHRSFGTRTNTPIVEALIPALKVDASVDHESAPMLGQHVTANEGGREGVARREPFVRVLFRVNRIPIDERIAEQETIWFQPASIDTRMTPSIRAAIEAT